MAFQQLMTETQAEFQRVQKKSDEYVARWEKYGLLEGLKGNEKRVIATLLQNQSNAIVAEAIQGTNQGGAFFTPGSGEQWAGIVLPMVRKIFADVLACKEFVSVQPMNLPAGLVFYLDIKYGNNRGVFQAGDSIYGNTSGSGIPTGGLYGTGRYGYSVNNATATAATTVTTASYAEVRWSTPLSASVVAGQIKKVAVPVAGLTDYNKENVRSFTISGSGVTQVNTLQDFTYTDGTNIYFYATGSNAQVVNGNVTVTFHKQTKDNFRGDYEDRGSALDMGEFSIDPKSIQVAAITRKLKARWTFESQQDFKAYLSIDIESELTNVLGEHVAREIDLEVIDMLVKNAVTKDTWSVQNNTVLNPAGTDFQLQASSYYNSQGEWFQTFGLKANKVSNDIHQKTLRGGANFMCLSPRMSTVLETIPGFLSSVDGDFGDFSAGIPKVGTFNSRYKVFKNPYYTENIVLMGYKGSSWLETGAAYCPYVPMMTTPLVYDPVNFTPGKSILTRYAKTMIRGEFYGIITIHGLDTL